MATFDESTLSHYVNEAGAYVVSISAIPEEYLHRPLIVHVGETLSLTSRRVERSTGWRAWCEEAKSPAYLRHDGHDPECPLDAASRPRRPGAGRTDS